MELELLPPRLASQTLVGSSLAFDPPGSIGLRGRRGCRASLLIFPPHHHRHRQHHHHHHHLSSNLGQEAVHTTHSPTLPAPLILSTLCRFNFSFKPLDASFCRSVHLQMVGVPGRCDQVVGDNPCRHSCPPFPVMASNVYLRGG